MKDREFSTKKLAESIKVLRKASGVNVKGFCKSIHMTEHSYYSVVTENSWEYLTGEKKDEVEGSNRNKCLETEK